MTATTHTLAALIRGKVHPATVPTILTDSGRVRLGLSSWWLIDADGERHELGSWADDDETVAAAYWWRVESALREVAAA